MREFLDEENQGLDALIDYLSFRLLMMRHEQRLLESHASSEEKLQTGKSRYAGPLHQLRIHLYDSRCPENGLNWSMQIVDGAIIFQLVPGTLRP